MLSACGDGTLNTDTEAGALSLNIVYHRSEDNDQRTADRINCESEGVKTIEADVYDLDNTPLATGGPWDCEEHIGSVESVPAGKNRKVIIYGKDEHGGIVFRGDDIIPIVISGQIAPVTVDCYQFSPRLQSPGRDTVVRGSSMKLRWTSVEGAFEYHLVVSENSDLSDPIIEHWTKEAVYSPEPSKLLIDESYYWQVYARDKNKNESKVSDIWSFTSAIVLGLLPDTGRKNDDPEIVGEDSDYTTTTPAYTKLDASGKELDFNATEWTMTRDDVTGLIWEVKTDDDSIHNRSRTYKWQQSQDEFIAQLNNDNFGGRADWRLPNIKELATLVKYSVYKPAVDLNYFRNTYWGDYWTSTEAQKDMTNQAWSLTLFDGSTTPDSLKDDPDAEKLPHVIAVCGNETGYNLVHNFKDNGDGTVTDWKTGLIWQKKSDAKKRTWLEALSYCEKLVLGRGNYDDWRMPNIRELQSIIEYDRGEQVAIDDTIFEVSAILPAYWSSTTFLGSFRWYTDFDDGHIDYIDSGPLEIGDQINLYIRAVRGGQ